MGIKYLLRGIGIGIVVTAIVLGSVNILDAKKDVKTPGTSASGLTTEAGTTEDSSLRRILEQNQAESTEHPSATTEISRGTTKEPADEATTASKQAAEDRTTTEQVKPDRKDTEEDKKAAVRAEVKIKNGMNCTNLAKLLEKEGIIKDAEEFSDYMEYNGYDYRLRTGYYTVRSDMTYKELAKLFMTRKQ